MANNADGSIIINAEIDTSNASAGVSDLSAILKSLEARFTELGTVIKDAGAKLTEFTKIFTQSQGNTGNGSGGFDDQRIIEYLQNLITTSGIANTRLQELIDTMKSGGGSGDKNTVNNWNATLVEFKNHLGLGANGIGGLFSKLTSKLTGLGARIKAVFTRKLINAFIQSITQGFSALTQYSATIGNSVNALKTSLNGLKGQIAGAFAPVIEYVVPILQTLVSWLSTAINYIAQFIGALMGKKTVISAVGKSVGSIGSGAKSASKEVKELQNQLAGFDDLEVLSADKGSGNGGGGGGGAGASALDYTFEDIPIDQNIADFVNRIKEAFEKGDGSLIGESLANLFNKAVAYLDNFLHSINFGNIANLIITGISSFIKNVDGQMIGDAIGTVLKGLAEMGETLFKNGNIETLIINMFNLACGIIEGLDVNGILMAIAKLLTRIVTHIPSMLLSIIKGLFNLIVEFAKLQYPTLADGIDEVAASINQTLDDNIKVWAEKGDDWADYLISLIDKSGGELVSETSKATTKMGQSMDKLTQDKAFQKWCDANGYKAEQFADMSINEFIEFAKKSKYPLDDFIQTEDKKIAGFTNNSVNNIKNMASQSATATDKMSRDVRGNLDNMAKDGTSAGSKLMSNMTSGISSGGSGLSYQTVTNVMNAVTQAKAVNTKVIGTHFIDGIITGMSNKTTELYKKIESIASTMVSKFNARLQIHSPSRVMAKSGEWIMAGVEEGIGDEENSVYRAMTKVAKGIANTNFNIPNVATSLMPYNINGSTAQNARQNAEMQKTVTEAVAKATTAIVNAIANSNVNVTVDKKALTDTLVNEINTRAKLTGISPVIA